MWWIFKYVWYREEILMMNKKALSIIGVSCLGAVLFAGSMFGGNTAEAGLNDY